MSEVLLLGARAQWVPDFAQQLPAWSVGAEEPGRAGLKVGGWEGASAAEKAVQICPGVHAGCEARARPGRRTAGP